MDGQLLGSIALADVIREESREAIRSLKQLGVKVAMITGDSDHFAKHGDRRGERLIAKGQETLAQIWQKTFGKRFVF